MYCCARGVCCCLLQQQRAAVCGTVLKITCQESEAKERVWANQSARKQRFLAPHCREIASTSPNPPRSCLCTVEPVARLAALAYYSWYILVVDEQICSTMGDKYFSTPEHRSTSRSDVHQASAGNHSAIAVDSYFYYAVRHAAYYSKR